jgi:hypothetical protein
MSRLLKHNNKKSDNNKGCGGVRASGDGRG